MTSADERVCRCGRYYRIHPLNDCTRPRHSFWWHRHYLWRHIAVRLWWALPSRARWRIAQRIQSDRRDWCELVDSCLHADDPDRRADYRAPHGCLCDFPLPTDAGPIGSGCYCVDPGEVAR